MELLAKTGTANGPASSVEQIAPGIGMMYSRCSNPRMRRPLVSLHIGTVPMVVTGTYNPYLVALSILVAAFASYTALDLGGRMGGARGLVRRAWLVAAAITM